VIIMGTIRANQQSGAGVLAGHACAHSPQCPAADSPGRLAARVIATHPEQGWSLLCNGVIAFDDGGMIAPEAGPAAPSRRRGLAA
jgi:hypothetical protein